MAEVIQYAGDACNVTEIETLEGEAREPHLGIESDRIGRSHSLPRHGPKFSCANPSFEGAFISKLFDMTAIPFTIVLL